MLLFLGADRGLSAYLQYSNSLMNTVGDGTYSRLGSATYMPTPSTIATVSANTPRYEGGGLLLEPSGINYAWDSNSFVLGGSTVWSDPYGGAVVTAAATTSPDGTANATKLENDGTGAIPEAGVIIQDMSGHLGGNHPSVVSVWAKAGTHNVMSIGVDGSDLSVFTLTDQWARYEYYTTNAGLNDLMVIAVGELGGASTTDKYIYIYGAQAEVALSNASSYMPSTHIANGTRGVDDLGIPAANMPSGDFAIAFTISIESFYTAVSNQTIWTDDVRSIDVTKITPPSFAALKFQTDNAGADLDGGSFTIHQPVRLLYTGSAAGTQMYVNGVLVDSDASNYTGATATDIYISSTPSTYANIRDIKIYDHNFSATEAALERHVI